VDEGVGAADHGESDHAAWQRSHQWLPPLAMRTRGPRKPAPCRGTTRICMSLDYAAHLRARCDRPVRNLGNLWSMRVGRSASCLRWLRRSLCPLPVVEEVALPVAGG